jgi:hypothetical protein
MCLKLRMGESHERHLHEDDHSWHGIVVRAALPDEEHGVQDRRHVPADRLKRLFRLQGVHPDTRAETHT